MSYHTQPEESLNAATDGRIVRCVPRLGVAAVLHKAALTAAPQNSEKIDPKSPCARRPGLRPVRLTDNYRFRRPGKETGLLRRTTEIIRCKNERYSKSPSVRQPLKAFQQDTFPHLPR